MAAEPGEMADIGVVQPADDTPPPEGPAVPEATIPAADMAVDADVAEPAEPPQAAAQASDLDTDLEVDAGGQTATAETEDRAPATDVTEPAAVTTDAAPAVQAAPTPALVPPAVSPLIAFAEPVEIDGEKPLLSFVILDDQTAQLGPAALASLDIPVTIVVPGTMPLAQDRMIAYRQAGFEVALGAAFPPDTSPEAVPAMMENYLSLIDQAVAVMDGSGSDFQDSSAVGQAVSEILQITGHGLITFESGFNAISEIAQAAALPLAQISQDLDANGQDLAVMRRFLDQAAFRAGRDGRLVVLARLRPESITALQIWSQQERAQGLNIVPVSAVLQP